MCYSRKHWPALQPDVSQNPQYTSFRQFRLSATQARKYPYPSHRAFCLDPSHPTINSSFTILAFETPHSLEWVEVFSGSTQITRCIMLYAYGLHLHADLAFEGNTAYSLLQSEKISSFAFYLNINFER